MKKLILTVAICLIATVGYCADGDIVNPEVVNDVAKWQLDSFHCYVFSKSCNVVYRKVDSNDNRITETRIIFQNVTDDPDTVEDETDTSFTDLVSAINSGSNIKTTIKNAVKIKLGL